MCQPDNLSLAYHFLMKVQQPENFSSCLFYPALKIPDCQKIVHQPGGECHISKYHHFMIEQKESQNNNAYESKKQDEEFSYRRHPVYQE